MDAPSDPTAGRTSDVLRHLETRTAVVILDNCEQVADGCRELIEALYRGCEHVAVIATSREPLRARGEVLWPVSPLTTPMPAEAQPSAVLASPAGRLFYERAVAVRPSFWSRARAPDSISRPMRRVDREATGQVFRRTIGDGAFGAVPGGPRRQD